MRPCRRFPPLLCICMALPFSVRGEVRVRWTVGEMPSAETLGLSDIVIPWNEDAKSLLETARKQGYRCYVEATTASLPTVAEALRSTAVAGVILRLAPGERAAAQGVLQNVQNTAPKLRILVLDARGKQPDMKGWLVFKRDGILQVSSPTSQPWVDSNLPLVRFARALDPNQPPFYAFSWDLSDPLQQKQGPSPSDYALAVAEACAFHADLLLEIPENQQRALASGDAEALKNWRQVKVYLEFYARARRDEAPEIAPRVAVLTGDYDSSYEALNLMARHNIAFRVLSASTERGAKNFGAFDILVVFASPDATQIQAIAEFAERGGIAVLVNLPGSYPWQTSPPAKTNAHSVSYHVGKGRVIELGEAVSDPETFARDIRRLMAKQSVPVSLWNSLTTLVAAYHGEKTDETVIELVNYAQELLQVQVQVKGELASVRFATPERGCCEVLTPSYRDGFTEFVVPDLTIGGRVVLSPRSKSAAASASAKN
jgi:hypothetical protein